VLQKVTLVS